jgi:hypothetical protein
MAVPLWADPRFRYASSIPVNEDRPGEEDTMHPDILWQLAAGHTRDLMTEAGEARLAREARHAQRRRLAAHLRRSTRLAAQQPGSRRESRIPVTPAAGGRVEGSR